MKSVKLAFGVVGTLVPLAYCGGLFFYFLSVGGSVQDAVSTGLGPTLLGLGAIGILFVIPVALKILRAISSEGSPSDSGSPRPSGRSRTVAGEEGEFDADAALARYMARKADQAPASAPAPSPRSEGMPARPVFGRKIG